MPRRILITAGFALLLVAVAGYGAYRFVSGSILRDLSDKRLVEADYWSGEPKILSAGYGFDGIIGLPSLEPAAVRAAGGAWVDGLTCTDGSTPPVAVRTSAATPDAIALAYKGFANHDDGLPVVFSWPLAAETVDPSDFSITLNTGEVVSPHAAGLFPNWELNERNVVVLFGDFGNRGRPNEPDARYAIRVDIIEDTTPLTLIGPGDREASAVGMRWETNTTPYLSGPYLVGAKINRVAAAPAGEGGALLLDRAPYMPNDEMALYGGGDFRLRLLTTGGFSPDGVAALQPDEFERHFRLHAKGTGGGTVLIEKTGLDYTVAGGRLRVLGLSDLGRKAPVYDACYVEDRDNYIDIILEGDLAAAGSIVYVEIPTAEPYAPFFNPGGPGATPTDGVRYTSAGPHDLEPVIDALDEPMRVSREP